MNGTSKRFGFGGWLALGALGLLFPGCEERAPETKSDAPPTPRGDAGRNEAAACGSLLGAPDRRLTRFELAYAIEDVFGVDASELHELPPPTRGIGDVPDILVGRMLDVSDAFLVPYRERLLVISERIGTAFAERCAAGAALRDCVVETLRPLAARLWRETDLEELGRELTASLDDAPGDVSAEEAFRLGAMRLLESPRFYLLHNEAEAGGTGTSDDGFAEERLASRLALLLWSSVPDARLLERAANGTLGEPAVLRAETERMLEDRRFERFAAEFTRQWLRLDRPPDFRLTLERVELSRDPALLAEMHAEVANFFRAAFAEERPIRALLEGDVSAFADPAEPFAPSDAGLAASDAGFTAEAANGATARNAGLLTSRAVLSNLSTPIRRGGNESWLGRSLIVQSSFLCRTFPLTSVYPPELWEGHPLLDPAIASTQDRPPEAELLQIRTTEGPCVECHAQLETIGVALDAFDAFGRALGSEPPAIEVAGSSVEGVPGLLDWIEGTARFEPCVAQKLLGYALGRAVLPQMQLRDRCLTQTLLDAENDARTLRGWLLSILESPDFTTQGETVVRDRPVTNADASGYIDPIDVPEATRTDCASFDAGAFLVRSCGTAACHGPGATRGTFAVPDAELARTLLSREPDPDGYCSGHAAYVDAEDPEASLILQKLLAGGDTCGAPMPVAGGPRSLRPLDVACFARWIGGHDDENAGE